MVWRDFPNTNNQKRQYPLAARTTKSSFMVCALHKNLANRCGTIVTGANLFYQHNTAKPGNRNGFRVSLFMETNIYWKTVAKNVIKRLGIISNAKKRYQTNGGWLSTARLRFCSLSEIQRRSQTVACPFQPVVVAAGVILQRRGRVAVAQVKLGVLDRRAAYQEQAGAGMAERVKAKRHQF